MKKSLSILFSIFSFLFLFNGEIISQSLIISEVADGTGPGGFPKICEITNTSTFDIVMDGMKLKLYTNGGTNPNSTYIFGSFSLPAGESLVLTNIDNVTSGQLWTDFNLTEPGYVIYNVSAVNSNGDDVYELTNASDVVVDVCGLVGQDGTGLGWDYLDSYAYRNSDITDGNPTFTISEWTFAGADFLDPYFTDLSPYLTPGLHIFVPSTAPEIINIIYTPANPTNSDPVDVSADVTPQGTASITNVVLNWGTVSGSLTNQINMTNISGNTYATDTQIPAQVNGTTVYFNIEATDDTPETGISMEISYYIGNPIPVITNIIINPPVPNTLDNVTVSADITDDGTINTATMFWGTDGTTFPNIVNMSVVSGNTYASDSDIPAQVLNTIVYYYIRAIDDYPDTVISIVNQYTVSQAPGSYLFLNGDFEDWTLGVPDEWTLIDDSITVSQETVIVHGGTYSAKFDVITKDQTDTDFRQWVSVISGQSYDLSVWVYHTDSLVKARIYCGIGSGAYLTYSDNHVIDQWQQVIATYIATATEDIEVGLRFYDQIGFTTQSTVYIDDYTFDFTNRISDKSHNNISVFPNPAGDYIYFKNLNNTKSVTISNIFGQVTDNFDVNNINIKYDLSIYSNGIYIISIENSDNTQTKLKFIKQ